MANDICTRRLQRELRALSKDPMKSPKIVAVPREENILEWHYLIEGNEGTPYHGGYYHGKLIFPKEYPLKPPSVIMCTPSGRFVTNRRLCLSMSDFHPETWNPMWSVSTILTGLYSFMNDNQPTAGSIDTSIAHKRKLALQSLEYNSRDPVFGKLFPEYVVLNKKQMEERGVTTTMRSTTSSAMTNQETGDMNSIVAAAAGLVALVSIVLAMFSYL